MIFLTDVSFGVGEEFRWAEATKIELADVSILPALLVRLFTWKAVSRTAHQLVQQRSRLRRHVTTMDHVPASARSIALACDASMCVHVRVRATIKSHVTSSIYA